MSRADDDAGLTALAVASAVSWLPWLEPLGLDRFTLVKELVLLAGAPWIVLRALGRSRISGGAVEALLASVLVLSVASAAIHGGCHPWRPVTLGVAGVMIFVAARGADRRALLGGIELATMVLAGSVVIEAWLGLGPSLPDREPGGTEGHRNFVAHAIAIGLPASLWLARERGGHAWFTTALAITAILLTRCRAAWLATIVGVGVLAIGSRWPRASGPGLISRRTALALAAGAALGILVPDRLDWRSATPLRDTAATLTDHARGSGRGRIVQYRTTLELARSAPWLGVGPGQWSIAYAAEAAPGDPNVDRQRPEPVNRFPNSDWLAFGAERGIPAACLLVAAGASIILALLMRLRHDDSGAALVGLTTAAVLIVLGALDAVLARPTPLVLAAMALAAGLGPPRRALGTSGRAALVLIAVAAAIVGFVDRASIARAAFARVEASPEALAHAAAIDNDDFRTTGELAIYWFTQERCDLARHWADVTLERHPAHPLALQIRTRCDARTLLDGRARDDRRSAPHALDSSARDRWHEDRTDARQRDGAADRSATTRTPTSLALRLPPRHRDRVARPGRGAWRRGELQPARRRARDSLWRRARRAGEPDRARRPRVVVPVRRRALERADQHQSLAHRRRPALRVGRRDPALAHARSRVPDHQLKPWRSP